jgi:predicted amidophosphoribosyltransferase
VVLIDDVMTSGASLSAATLALLEAGACGVQAMVVARTPP